MALFACSLNIFTTTTPSDSYVDEHRFESHLQQPSKGVTVGFRLLSKGCKLKRSLIFLVQVWLTQKYYHSKFNLTEVQTHDLQIMIVHLMSLRHLSKPLSHQDSNSLKKNTSNRWTHTSQHFWLWERRGEDLGVQLSCSLSTFTPPQITKYVSCHFYWTIVLGRKNDTQVALIEPNDADKARKINQYNIWSQE